MGRRRTTAAVGLCYLSLPSSVLAFHSFQGQVLTGRARSSRQRAASVAMMARDEDRQGARRNMSNHDESPRRLSARQDIAALVMSAMLLGGSMAPSNANAASVTDTRSQENMIADLENKLIGMQEAKPMPPQADDPQAPAKPSPSAGTISALTESNDVPPTSISTNAPSVKAGDGATPSLKAAEDSPEPLIKLKDYTFSITLPELNLPKVGPITVPEKGLGAPALPRVAPLPNAPAVDALVEKTGSTSTNIMQTLAGSVPKQADFERAVNDLENTLKARVRTTQNPAFASDVELDPLFSGMFMEAKKAVAHVVSPFVAKGTDPELAIFMLATLPVLTVALRAADNNYRRPKVPEEKVRRPRLVKFPNSPAKVDREAVAEAAMARAASAPAPMESPVALGKAQDGTPAASRAPVVVKEILTEVGLERNVAVAVASDPERLRDELARLRKELSETSKLATKVEALERANARLREEVAQLSKRPSPEEALRRAQQKEMTAERERQRQERQRAIWRSAEERSNKINAARKKLAEAFPTPSQFLLSKEEEEAVVESVDVPTKVPAVPSVSNVEFDVGGMETGDGTETGMEEDPRELDKFVHMREDVTSIPPNTDSDMDLAVGVRQGASSGMKPRAEAETRAGTAASKYDHMSDGVARALKGVRDFDVDGLGMGMDDLSPAELEELKKIEMDMGDLDLEALDAEFAAGLDQEDDEAISQALRMAAASAMAHATSGGSDRIRTTSSLTQGSGAGSSSNDAPNGGNNSMMSDESLTSFEQEEDAGADWSYPDDSTMDEGLIRDQQTEPRSRARDAAGSTGDWGTLSPSALKKKTVAELKAFLAERGMPPKAKEKKAELVERVSELLQLA